MNMGRENKTVKGYWDDMWKSSENAQIINPRSPGVRNYTTRLFHAYFDRVFSSLDKEQSKLLEIGCANSAWLPYFCKEFDMDVTGLDYSEVGCDSARRNLEQSSVKGDVVCADLFSPPPDMFGRFDVVVSFGVVEHFEDTSKCLIALSKFLKEGGLLITSIPNMSGLLGSMQKYVNRPVFEIHNPLTSEQFHQAHVFSGIKIIECGYFMSIGFGVCNLNGVPQKSVSWLFKKILLAFLTRVSMLVWVIEGYLGRLPAKRFLSPYIICLSRKQQPGSQ